MSERERAKGRLPKIGLRNIKTAISVFLCIILFQALDRPHPFYACIAAVMCTKETVAITYKASFDRMIGSILGGFMGMILIIISPHINSSTADSLMSGIGIIIVIYMCNLIKRPGACAISCIVLLSITTTVHDSTPYLYALNRVVDTFIGIIITIIINRFIYPRENIC